MLEKVKQFVDESVKAKNPEKSMIHFERAVHWAKQLKPDADESILIAAYAHDIGRAFAFEDAGFWKNKEVDDPEYLEKHQMDSARVISEFLQKQSYKDYRRVEHMVRYHEVGGDPDSDLIKDADSISYLEVNAPRHVKNLGKLHGKRKTRTKFDFIFNRISSEKAKKIAEPFYKKAVEMLEESE